VRRFRQQLYRNKRRGAGAVDDGGDGGDDNDDNEENDDPQGTGVRGKGARLCWRGVRVRVGVCVGVWACVVCAAERACCVAGRSAEGTAAHGGRAL